MLTSALMEEVYRQNLLHLKSLSQWFKERYWSTFSLQVDFTFPFQAKHKIDDDGLLNVTLIPAFVSFGSSLVANCKVESDEQLFLPCWAEKQLLADNRLIKG